MHHEMLNIIIMSYDLYFGIKSYSLGNLSSKTTIIKEYKIRLKKITQINLLK